MNKVAVCCGTRPDVIKMQSVYWALRSGHITVYPELVFSAQHDQMGRQMLDLFGLKPDVEFDIPQYENRSLADLTSQLLRHFGNYFEKTKPVLVLCHGDNVTGFAAGLAAYFSKIPVGHVEAGLRTSRFENPNPEEGIRRMLSHISTLHFAPTNQAARNLYYENIHKNVYVTGNTVVDALRYVLKLSDTDRLIRLKKAQGNKKLILVTCHRRENWGKNLTALARHLLSIPKEDCFVVFSVHENPTISNTIREFLSNCPGISLESLLDYNTFLKLLDSSDLIITDSGGVIEEASTLGKPMIILRDEIERPEALELPSCTLFDFKSKTNLNDLIMSRLNKRVKLEKTNIFGEGDAGSIIADIVIRYLDNDTKKD